MITLNKLKQFLAIIDEDLNVVIKVKLPNTTLGGTQSYNVEHVNIGFDWDRGKLIITPDRDLTPTDENFVERYKNMENRLGYIDLENRRLKAEIKRLEGKVQRRNSNHFIDGINNENF